MKAILKIGYTQGGQSHDIQFDLGQIDANEYTKAEHVRQIEACRYHWERRLSQDVEYNNDAITIWYSLQANEEEHLVLWDKGIMINTRIPKARQKQT